MTVRPAISTDGHWFEVQVQRGRGHPMLDVRGARVDFVDSTTYLYVTIKGNPPDLGYFYSRIRAEGLDLFGKLPFAMPKTEVSNLADFIWDARDVNIEDEQIADRFSALIGTMTFPAGVSASRRHHATPHMEPRVDVRIPVGLSWWKRVRFKNLLEELDEAEGELALWLMLGAEQPAKPAGVRLAEIRAELESLVPKPAEHQTPALQ